MDGSNGVGGYQYTPGSQPMQYRGYGMSPYNMSYNYYGVQPPLPPGPPPPSSNPLHISSAVSTSYLPPPPPLSNNCAPPSPLLPPGTAGNGSSTSFPPANESNSRHGGLPPPPGTYHQNSTPPPPPPPPGVYNKSKDTMSCAVLSQYTPLMPVRNVPFVSIQSPPLPPVFPWMTPVGAPEGSTNQYNKFEKDKSLPFVPVVINNAELNKMTETVQKQAKIVKGKNLYEDIIDEELPKKLRDMFQPLYCKLCALTLSSPIVARDHYKGKRHKKAIDAWFEQNPSERKGANMGVNFIPVGSGIVKPSLPTDTQNGSAGRGRGIMDMKRGLPKDFANQGGNKLLGNSRIGCPSHNVNSKIKNNQIEPPSKKMKKEKKEANSGPNFGYCDACQVSLTSQVNSDQHYKGKPHNAKILSLRKLGELGDIPRYGFGADFLKRPKVPVSSVSKIGNTNRKQSN